MRWWANRKRSAAWAEQPPRAPGDSGGPVNAHAGTPYLGGQAIDVSATSPAPGAIEIECEARRAGGSLDKTSFKCYVFMSQYLSI